MPYTIRKLPNKELYRVKKYDGTILAKGTTLKKAKAQIRLLESIESKKENI